MSIIALIIWLLVLGFAAYLIQAYAPMEIWIKRILIGALVLIALLITLHAFGIIPALNQSVPQVR